MYLSASEIQQQHKSEAAQNMYYTGRLYYAVENCDENTKKVKSRLIIVTAFAYDLHEHI